MENQLQSALKRVGRCCSTNNCVGHMTSTEGAIKYRLWVPVAYLRVSILVSSEVFLKSSKLTMKICPEYGGRTFLRRFCI
jgi:hypothetical protein